MILFLGAGASRAFEIPTTKEFISLFEKKIGKSDLYNDLKMGITEDLFDLESLMTVLDDLSKPEDKLLQVISPHTSRFMLRKYEQEALRYNRKDGIEDASKQLLQQLRKIIREECLKAVMMRKAIIIETYDAFFDSAIQLPGSSNQSVGNSRVLPLALRIFTTNYDTCVETYLNEKHVDFANGIERRWGYNVFSIDAFRGKSIELFKLHGSIDLFKKGEDIRQFQSFGIDVKNEITYLGEDYGEEFMVYPIESSGAGHVIQSPYLDLYNLLRERLNQELSEPSNTLVLVGSSFRDLTIVGIMNEVLRLRKGGVRPLVIFIDPRAGSVIQSLKKYGFTALAEHILPIEGEFGKADVFEKLRAIRRK